MALPRRSLCATFMIAVLSCDADRPAVPTPADATATAAPTAATPTASSASAPASVATTYAGPRAAPTHAKRPASGWPLPRTCVAEPCRLEGGMRGVRCDGACFNPCPAGMAPRDDLTFCEKRCRTTADCPEGDCRDGLCDSWPKPPCERQASVGACELPDGRFGFRCHVDGSCHPNCKRGLVLYGGTHCAKPCARAADCPGGRCERAGNEPRGICVPLCPSEGCPYPWE